jgi:cytochrome bd ubiquinol oxidase subunit I
MQDLLTARVQMAMSLAFHIVFACVGVAMPLLMAIAEWLYPRTGDDVYDTLAQRWATGTAIMFAVGEVSFSESICTAAAEFSRARTWLPV